MKLLCLLFATLLLLGCDESSSPAKAESEIRETFGAFRKALAAKQGAKALEVVDDETIALFERVRTNALEATPETLNGLSGYELILTLLLRYELFPEALEEMAAKELFTRTVDEGWLAAETSLEQLEMGEIELLDPKVGSGVATRDDKDTDFQWTFRKGEGGEWKLDLTPLAVAISREVEGRLITAQGTRSEMALRVLEEALAQPIGREILYQE